MGPQNGGFMSQRKMSLMLKGIAYTGMVMLLIFEGYMITVFATHMQKFQKDKVLDGFKIGFSVLMGIFCMIAIVEFIKICNEIGKDNSFSVENMKSLSRIAILGMSAAAGWFLAFITVVILDRLYVGYVVLLVITVAISLTVSIVATVLAHLVQKAYNLKMENELTI